MSGSEVDNSNPEAGEAGGGSALTRGRRKFRVLHDPGLYPLAGERYMTQFEVQFGLRYNTFPDGTVIMDVVAGSRHEVVVKKLFKPTNKGGMLALLESQLQPTHAMINPKSYDEQGRYLPE